MELASPFAETFDAENLTLFKTEHWSVLVRKSQVTLGSLVLAANRCFLSASEMTAEELGEFPQVVGRLERTLSDAFGFDKINYLCLMMKDRHYHFHVFPRYEGAREFAGTTWEDAGWPGAPALATPPAEQSVLFALRDHLRNLLA